MGNIFDDKRPEFVRRGDLIPLVIGIVSDGTMQYSMYQNTKGDEKVIWD